MTPSFFRLIIYSAYNGIKFRYLRLIGKTGSPKALSLEITHRCIARCIMCNIWKIPADIPDPSIKELLELLSKDIFSNLVELDITGGEPFIRKDITGLFSGICRLKKKNLKSLKSIAVTTNGLLTRQVISALEQSLPLLKDSKIHLVVVCALDSAGSLHDNIRNYKGAWEKVRHTIRELKELRKLFPNLILGLKTTILPINIEELDGINCFAEKNDLFTIISPCIITPGRYLNPELADSLKFTQKDKNKIIDFFQKRSGGWQYHQDKLIQYLKTGVMKKNCTCGYNYYFIRSSGEVFLCPLIKEGAGSLKKASLESIINSKKSSQIRRKIGRFPECQVCTEPGLERYALPCEGFSYLFMLLKMGKKSFFKLHTHMGLDMYFE
ncbi:Radical SAM and SPASM domains-containing protein [Desulfonema limicola]|uniref:Radical SAM and SPASM domains-containing protein n=1 Tax=Desulfonema limicola TaxID=45656 RepID=A0A975B9I9_9BACT|nr:radical SAM protein [Desulfonema limicola]QTA81421.1 Radical SAM and SPASM domains-containing protein [Desulfonema limicola]